MNKEEICIICGDLLSSKKTRIIHQESIKNCIKASLRRQDAKHIEFRKYNSLQVHESCSKSYVSEVKILAELKRRSEQSTEQSSSTKSLVTRSTENINFDFTNFCFICCKDASDDFIKQQSKLNEKRRSIVHLVNNDKIRVSLLENLKNVSDKNALDVYARLVKVENLVTVGARYHVKCYRSLEFIKIQNVSDKKESLPLQAAKFIARYILENKEEYQYNIYHLLENFESDQWPNMKYLKKHLMNIFGDEIIRHSSKYGPIITMSAIHGKILSDNFYTNRKSDMKEERKRIVLEASNIILEDIRTEFYDVVSYPSPDCFLQDVHYDIPETLQLMLNTIISNRKQSALKYSIKN